MLTSEHGMIGGRSSSRGSWEVCLFVPGTSQFGERQFYSLQGGWSMTDSGSVDARTDRYREVD